MIIFIFQYPYIKCDVKLTPTPNIAVVNNAIY